MAQAPPCYHTRIYIAPFWSRPSIIPQKLAPQMLRVGGALCNLGARQWKSTSQEIKTKRRWEVTQHCVHQGLDHFCHTLQWEGVDNTYWNRNASRRSSVLRSNAFLVKLPRKGIYKVIMVLSSAWRRHMPAEISSSICWLKLRHSTYKSCKTLHRFCGWLSARPGVANRCKQISLPSVDRNLKQ